MEEKIRSLNPRELEDVSGGFVVNDPEENKFWIVRQDGSVIGPAPSRENAVEFAKAFNTSPEVITREEYKMKFGRDLVW